MAQYAQTKRIPSQTTVIASCNKGLNNYLSPLLTNPQMWYAASNVFSGPFSYVQRARFADLVTGATSGYAAQHQPFLSLGNYFPPGFSYYVLGDVNGFLYSFDTANSYAATKRINAWIDPAGAGNSQLMGPWFRQVVANILYEMNGQVKQSYLPIGEAPNQTLEIETFGIDSPDSSPLLTVVNPPAAEAITAISRSGGIVTVTLAAALTVAGGNGIGMINVSGVADTTFNGTFVLLTGSGTASLTYANAGSNDSSSGGTVDTQITKSIGRSYAYAWENANKFHVGAPSPSTPYILYNSQNGVLLCIEAGTISGGLGSNTITGTGTAFSAAWVGRYLVALGTGAPTGAVNLLITAVNQQTQTLTLAQPLAAALSAVNFQVYDPGMTHIRLYATADGGATYYRIERSAFDTTSAPASVWRGLQLFDNANAEPPNFPYTTETSQLYNIPPPIGKYLYQYMGQLISFGVPGAEQSFFYSTAGLTTIGLPQESFPPLNQITLPIQGANIGGMAAFPSALVVWDDKEDMYRITGLLADNTTVTAQNQGATVQQLPFSLGCTNPFAVVDTPLGAVWLSPQNEIWLYTDTYAPSNIGRSIQGTLNQITRSNLGLVRAAYYHTDIRDWVVFAVPVGAGATANNTLLILDVDLLSSNGQPSFFTFDMATNQPSWYQFDIPCSCVDAVFEQNGTVRLLTGAVDNILDSDFQALGGAYGVERPNVPGFITLHSFGNEDPNVFKKPNYFRFITNMAPQFYAVQGWSFRVDAYDDDRYVLGSPLTLNLIPGVNDTATLSGHVAINPLAIAESFRWSQARFRIGAVNFIMGRRFQLTVNFPEGPGTNYQFHEIELGYASSPPR